MHELLNKAHRRLITQLLLDKGAMALTVVLGGAIRGRVLVVETLGRQVLVTIDLDGTTVKMLADTRPAIGTQVGIGYSPGSLHYFGSDGRRIEARTA